jgi:FlaA1/EpsC-like NDP-sugar epimerase
MTFLNDWLNKSKKMVLPSVTQFKQHLIFMTQMKEESRDFFNKMKPNDFSDARVLVTGGAGFIGSASV